MVRAQNHINIHEIYPRRWNSVYYKGRVLRVHIWPPPFSQMANNDNLVVQNIHGRWTWRITDRSLAGQILAAPDSRDACQPRQCDVHFSRSWRRQRDGPSQECDEQKRWPRNRDMNRWAKELWWAGDVMVSYGGFDQTDPTCVLRPNAVASVEEPVQKSFSAPTSQSVRRVSDVLISRVHVWRRRGSPSCFINIDSS